METGVFFLDPNIFINVMSLISVHPQSLNGHIAFPSHKCAIFVRIKAAQGFLVPAKRDLYAAAGNPQRTQIRAKRAIYGWKLIKSQVAPFNSAEALSIHRHIFSKTPLRLFIIGCHERRVDHIFQP